MRPYTIKQLELLSDISYNADSFHIGGLKSQRDVGNLRKWKRFDPDIIEEIEKKFADIAMISKEISSRICILKNAK